MIATCGDGFVRSDQVMESSDYEACDDGNESNEDGCLSDCSLARAATATHAVT